MKISSWNVNSVRARIINIINYLKYSDPDILMIQEIKTEEKNFPFSDFKNIGYDSYVFGQKSYNGVALLSKIKINKIDKQFFQDINNQSRIIIGHNKNIIIGGDFNVIPEEIDVYDYTKYINDALFKIEIRKKFRELINLGFNDVYRYIKKDKQEYTFWDYMAGSWQKNHGMRIDHFLVSNNLLNDIKDIRIDKKPRSKLKPSDHTPIELEIN